MPLLTPGQAAPDFSLVDQSGKPRSLSEFAGRHVVLYFYPKDDTSSCTRQACDFQAIWPQLKKLGTQVVGISPDPTASHARFAKARGLTFPILSDVPGDSGTPAVIAAFGAWGQKSMYGRTYMGVIRTTYLITPAGTVAACWSPVKVPGHAAQIAAALAGSPPKPPKAPAKPAAQATAPSARTTAAKKTSKAPSKGKVSKPRVGARQASPGGRTKA